MTCEQFGKQAHHHLAVFKHVRHAGRHAQVILEYIKFAGTRTHDIDASDVCVDIARYGDALHLGAVLCIAKHLLGRHRASAHDVLFVIDVVNEQVERLYALTQPLLQGLPFGSRDDARDDVKRN